MKVARILRFGPPAVILNSETARPEPASGQGLVCVRAAEMLGGADHRRGKIVLEVAA